MNPTKETSSLSYLNATEHIPYGMTNDYMFRLILEKNNYVLKGLICSLLSLTPEKTFRLKSKIPFYLMKRLRTKNLF